MWLRDPKRPESRATLELGRSYTQHAPTTQHEVAAVYPIPPCFEVGQRFRDASSPGLPWALFSIFFVAHTRRDSNLRRPPSTWEISPEVMFVRSNWQPLAPRRRGVAT